MNRFPRYIVTAFLGAAAFAAMTHWHGPTARADATYSFIASPTEKFIVHTILIGSVNETVRLDTTTGDAWYINGSKWAKYTDDTPPGPGAYDMQMLSMPDGKTYQMFRADLNSGRVWYVTGTKWALVTEQ